ncbi:MAG: outer membrane lipoprotein carrier protein LolA [Bacteroidales bacterium]|nr:outer membrane lipoprotein carrier protein LolA [Bacteroidales bacterium]
MTKPIFALTFLLSLLTINLVSAQVKDPAAKEIIDRMAAKAKAYTSIVADFQFTFENEAEGIKEEYKGKAWIKGDMYKINLMGQLLICDGKTIWTVLEDVGEVNITNRDLSDDSFMNNPSKLFSSYETNFKYKYIGEEKTAKGLAAVVELYPLQPEQGLKSGSQDSGLSKIRLVILKSTAELISARYYSQGATNYLIVLETMQTNQALTIKDFTFNAALYPKMEVIDLRE